MSDNSNPVNLVDALPANPEDGMLISFDGLLSEDGPVEKVSALPANPTNGDLIAPTADITVGEGQSAVTYEQGKYYIYETNAWAEYDGDVLDGENIYQWSETDQEWKVYTGDVD